MLNLLPPKQKQELRFNLLNQMVISAGVSITFMVLILILLLLTGRLIINIQLSEVEKELTIWRSRAEISELEILEKNIKGTNNNLTLLNGLYQKQNKFSLFLESLAEDTPADIHLNNLSLGESGSVNISGYAPTRNALINFKGILENALYISEFNFPLSNLTQATNINFRLDFKLTPLEVPQ